MELQLGLLLISIFLSAACLVSFIAVFLVRLTQSKTLRKAADALTAAQKIMIKLTYPLITSKRISLVEDWEANYYKPLLGDLYETQGGKPIIKPMEE